MIVEFHCKCEHCGGVSVFPRDMKYPGPIPQIHIPFSINANSWKCKGCGVVWGVEMEITNMTEAMDDEDLERDMPTIEGRSKLGGKVAAGPDGGLKVGD